MWIFFHFLGPDTSKDIEAFKKKKKNWQNSAKFNRILANLLDTSQRVYYQPAISLSYILI